MPGGVARPAAKQVKIKELTTYAVRIPLRRVIKHASHSRTETDNILVRCVLENGTVGFGEGVPRDYVTGETVESTLELLSRSQLPAQFEACKDFQHAVAFAERLRLPALRGDDRGIQGNAARCALELAVLDAYGQYFKEPLSAVTRMLAPELFEPKAAVRYSGAITSAKGAKLRLAAWAYWLYGFRQIKVKVGIAEQDDRERLRSIRKRVGKKMDLRIDANEAWNPTDAVEHMRALEPFGVSSVEQPCPHENLADLVRVRRQITTPIMLDESLCGMIDAERAVGFEACDLFNLRLSKCGGFIPTLRLAQFAKRHGLACQLGCQVGETAVLSAAGRHFACSVAGLRDRRLL